MPFLYRQDSCLGFKLKKKRAFDDCIIYIFISFECETFLYHLQEREKKTLSKQFIRRKTNNTKFKKDAIPWTKINERLNLKHDRQKVLTSLSLLLKLLQKSCLGINWNSMRYGRGRGGRNLLKSWTDTQPHSWVNKSAFCRYLRIQHKNIKTVAVRCYGRVHKKNG